MTLLFFGERFTSANPIIMFAMSGDTWMETVMPLVNRTNPSTMTMISLLLFRLMTRRWTTYPKARPIATEMAISRSGWRIMASGPRPSAPTTIADANAIVNPKSVMQKASSKATTPKSVDTSGPLARSSVAMATVAAGAVAEAMAPRSSAIGSGAPKNRRATATAPNVASS